MLPFVIAGLAAGAVLLIAIGVAMSGGSGGVSSRLERYASARGQESSDGDEEKESVVMAGLSRVMETQDLSARLSTELAAPTSSSVRPSSLPSGSPAHSCSWRSPSSSGS